MPLIKIVKLIGLNFGDYYNDYDIQRLCEVHNWEEISDEDLVLLKKWQNHNREYGIIEYTTVQKEWIESAKDLVREQEERLAKSKLAEEEKKRLKEEKKLNAARLSKEKLYEQLKVELGKHD